MKIVFFTENTHAGGLDTFLITLINNWPNRLDELTLICNKNHPGLKVIEERVKRPCNIVPHSVPVYYDILKKLKKYPNLFQIRKVISTIIRYLLLIYYIISLRKVLFKNDPDRLMVVAGNYPGGDICRAAAIVWGLFSKKSPAIYNFHNTVQEPVKWLKWIEFIIDWLVCRYSFRLITVSNATLATVKARPILARKAKIGFIYNGIDNVPENLPRVSDDNSLKEELGLSPDSKICLMLATYEKRKGHEFLVSSFAKVVEKIPEAHLVICGYGEAEDIKRVEDLMLNSQIKKNIHLFGFKSNISTLLNNSDILVVPSQFAESFGLTCVEAMAYHVPVVATNVGGLAEVVENGEGGYCLNRTDVDGYADKIIKLLEDGRLREEQGRKGHLRYKRMFTGGRMAKEYSQMICEGVMPL